MWKKYLSNTFLQQVKVVAVFTHEHNEKGSEFAQSVLLSFWEISKHFPKFV